MGKGIVSIAIHPASRIAKQTGRRESERATAEGRTRRAVTPHIATSVDACLECGQLRERRARLLWSREPKGTGLYQGKQAKKQTQSISKSPPGSCGKKIWIAASLCTLGGVRLRGGCLSIMRAPVDLVPGSVGKVGFANRNLHFTFTNCIYTISKAYQSAGRGRLSLLWFYT